SIFTLGPGGGAKAAIEGSRALDLDPFHKHGLHVKHNLLIPPLGVGSLIALTDFVSESNILEQCIDAMETNVDGFGFRLEPIVPEGIPKGSEAEAEAEKARLMEFFEFAFHEGSFVDLRQRKRRDQESVGIGYWEVIRDPAGAIMRLNHIPAHSIRMTPYDDDVQTINEKRRIGATQKDVKLSRRFRRFAQIQHSAGIRKMVWFKEFGDPRHMNWKTGEFVGARTRLAATEIIPFPVKYFPLNPYSQPRWIGNLTSVMGSRAAEEINLIFFDNKTVPPQVITVTGGRLTKATKERIRDQMQYEIMGRENFWRTLILEAVPTDQQAAQGGGNPKVEIKPLTDQMLKDAMFMEYDSKNRMKIRSAFRLAPLLIGEAEDYTRATADTSLRVTEEQMFAPERTRFDHWVNRWLMPALDSKFWRFRSLGPNVSPNEDLVSAIEVGERSGAMTPTIARSILSDVLERELPAVEDPAIANRPYSLTLSESKAGVAPTLPGGPPMGEPGERAFERAMTRLPERVREQIRRDLHVWMQRNLRKEIGAYLKKLGVS
ncbi:MAG: phage portal protein, partial [Nitrospinota bacterium]